MNSSSHHEQPLEKPLEVKEGILLGPEGADEAGIPHSIPKQAAHTFKNAHGASGVKVVRVKGVQAILLGLGLVGLFSAGFVLVSIIAVVAVILWAGWMIQQAIFRKH